MEDQAVTAFGAAFAAPAQTAAVLRARANAAGLDARQPAPGDLLAAVVGAQAWMCGLGAASLGDVRGPEAAAALAAVYCRAGGHADRPLPPTDADARARLVRLGDQVVEHAPVQLPQETLAGLAAAVDWLRRQTGHAAEAAAVLVAAAEDLSAGWGDPVLVAVSDALLTLAHSD